MTKATSGDIIKRYEDSSKNAKDYFQDANDLVVKTEEAANQGSDVLAGLYLTKARAYLKISDREYADAQLQLFTAQGLSISYTATTAKAFSAAAIPVAGPLALAQTIGDLALNFFVDTKVDGRGVVASENFFLNITSQVVINHLKIPGLSGLLTSGASKSEVVQCVQQQILNNPKLQVEARSGVLKLLNLNEKYFGQKLTDEEIREIYEGCTKLKGSKNGCKKKRKKTYYSLSSALFKKKKVGK